VKANQIVTVEQRWAMAG